MKIYIMYNSADEGFAKKLETNLKEKGCKALAQNHDDKRIALDFDYEFFIVVLSKRSLKSSKYQDEILNLRMIEEGKKKKGKKITLISVTVEDCYLPILLISKENFNFIDSYDVAFENLFRFISDNAEVINEKTVNNLSNLNSKYNNGELTLFCGSGISAGSGLPTWEEIIHSLIKETVHETANEDEQDNILKLIPTVFQKSYTVLGQYLQDKQIKSKSKKAFYNNLRSKLYPDTEKTSNVTLDAIVSLCKGNGSKGKLNSIITLNYDDLLEQMLLRNGINNFISVTEEGQWFLPECLPIFHVHGFLPRDGDLESCGNVVFGESTYHAMYNDPYCWQNRIQMDYLCRNTCIFIGLSMYDPNLRRLLSIARQKCQCFPGYHYIIKKRISEETIFAKLKQNTNLILNREKILEGIIEKYRFDNEMQKLILNFVNEHHFDETDLFSTLMDIQKIESGYIKTLVVTLRDIEEEDAEYLGLKTIWVNDYDEITDIVDKIRAEN